MKKPLLAFIWLLLTAIPAISQQKLWTWKPGGRGSHVLCGIGMHESGAAAFVLGEFDDLKSKVKFTLVWINKSGNRVMERNVDWNIGTARESIAYYSSSSFSVSFLGPNTLAVYPMESNGADYQISIYKAGSSKVTFLDPYKTMLFSPGNFAGWLSNDSKIVRFTSKWGDEASYQDIESISAFSVK